MAGAKPLELRFGLSAGFRLAPLVTALLGLSAILLAPAGLGWKLLLAVSAAAAAALVHRDSLKKSRSGRIRLDTDGNASVDTAGGEQLQLVLNANGWATRWISLLTLFEPESGKQYHCVICASENPSDEYRRLLRTLNMQTPAANTQRTHWL